MRTDALITTFSKIAIHTENLDDRWITVPFKPTVQSCSCPSDVFAMSVPVVVNVIQSEKKWFSFATTSTFISAISHNSFILKSIVVTKRSLSSLFRMFSVPFSSFLNDMGGILSSVINKVFLVCRLSFLIVNVLTSLAVQTILFKLGYRFSFMASLTGLIFHFVTSSVDIVIESQFDYNVKGKAQRLSRKGVGFKRTRSAEHPIGVMI